MTDRMSSPRAAVSDDGEVVSFDVTVRAVIGTVETNVFGQRPPHVVAFELIAMHDTPGTYEFPMPDGRTCCVEVAYVEPT